MRLSVYLTVFLAVGLPGCATFTTGSDQAIRVATEPAGATCQLSRDGVLLATVQTTPGAAFVSKSGHDIAVNCTMPGRTNGAAVIPAGAQEAALGNIIFGGLFGYGIDLASGAAAEYPRNVRIWLDPLNDLSNRQFGDYTP